MFKLKVNPDDSPIISLVQKPMSSSSVTASSVESGEVRPTSPGLPRAERFGSQRSVKSFDGVVRSGWGDPFAADEDGIKPLCMAVKSPTQLNKYLVHWLKPNYSTDVYQVGREPGPGIDMVVPGASYIHPTSVSPHYSSSPSHLNPTLLTSNQSRFPFRLVCSRSSGTPPRLYAGSFDAAGRLLLGSRELRFVDDLGRADALVGNSVLVWRPDWNVEGGWVEVSAVYGSPCALRTDSGVPGDRILAAGVFDGQDGVSLGREAIIYAGGVFFLWNMGEIGEEEAWTFKEFEEMLRELEEKVVCPVTLDTIQTDHVAESI
ncbi:hypothetical protein HDU67_005152, partial [Dinochytrium kinnereticum]